MVSVIRCAAALAVAAWLAGCAGAGGGTIGADFARPTPTTFVLGETTQAEILQRYGSPRHESSETRAFPGATPEQSGDQGLLTWSAYLYLPDPVAQSGVLRRKELTFVFWNHRLVSYRFNSTFPEDKSDFDAAKLAELAKGQSKRGDATRLLGEPTGMSIYPVTGNRALRFIAYTYREFDGAARARRLKRLTLHLDPSDVVVDYRFETRTDPFRPASPTFIPVPIPVPFPVPR